MTPLRKALAASTVILALASVPSRLAAEERAPAPAQARASVLDWFSGIWNELTALVAAETSLPPAKPGGGATTDGSCGVDPNGGCVEGG
jgi:hypothetical protein